MADEQWRERYTLLAAERDSLLSQVIHARRTSVELLAERDELLSALTPSAETKAAYSGEFKFPQERTDFDGNEYCDTVTVPWTTIKEIMVAIRARAALTQED